MNKTTAPENDRILALVAQAEALSAGGLAQEASLLFGRVLAHDPDHGAARDGLERARLALAESERRSEARLAEARLALTEGDPARARLLLEDVLASGSGHDAALALVDRLDERPGVVLARPQSRGVARLLHVEPAAPRLGRWRAAFVAAWSVALLLFGARLAFSWERLVVGLVAPPSPVAAGIVAPRELARATPADAALSQAREALDAGDLAGALAALDRIEPQDAPWPFAQQLRARAQARAASPKEVSR